MHVESPVPIMILKSNIHENVESGLSETMDIVSFTDSMSMLQAIENLEVSKYLEIDCLAKS